MRFDFFILILTFLISCSNKIGEKEDKSNFSFPKIIDSGDTLIKESKKTNVKTMAWSYPDFEGIYSFKQDTIDINYKKVIQNLDYYSELLPNDQNINDSLNTDGLEIFVNYNSSINKRAFFSNSYTLEHYPVYIVNNTNEPKLLNGKDLLMFGLQEAVIEPSTYYQKWHPVEMRGWDFCGNGYWQSVLFPNHYAVLSLPKYEGDFETKIRVRIKNGESIYLSKPFNATINKSQFYMKDSTELNNFINGNPFDIVYAFYGAKPILELEPKP